MEDRQTKITDIDRCTYGMDHKKVPGFLGKTTTVQRKFCVPFPCPFRSTCTPRRSLTIFPPTHCTHEYLASPSGACICVRASASASVLLRLRPCVCIRPSASASVHLRLRPCVCVSVRPSVCPSVRLQVGPCGPCVCGSGTNIYNYVTVHAIGKIDFEI